MSYVIQLPTQESVRRGGRIDISLSRLHGILFVARRHASARSVVPRLPARAQTYEGSLSHQAGGGSPVFALGGDTQLLDLALHA